MLCDRCHQDITYSEFQSAWGRDLENRKSCEKCFGNGMILPENMTCPVCYGDGWVVQCDI